MPKEKKTPKVDYSQCMACRACITACPFSCLDDVKTDVDKYVKAYPELVRPESCTGCGLCARACPIEVIQMVV